MSDYVISGAPLPVTRKFRYHWERGVGWRTIGRFIGTEQSASGLLTDLQKNWDRIDVIPDDSSPLVEIEASVNDIDEGQEVAESTWELLPNMVEKDIFLHPTIQALGDDLIALIKDALDDPEASWIQKAARPGKAPPAVVDRIFKMINAGFRSFRQYVPTLRLSEIASSRYSLRLSEEYVGLVIPSALIVEIEKIPPDVMFLLPKDTPNIPNFRWGWFKTMATTRRTAYGKFTMTQDWEYGHYPTDFFTFVTPAAHH